MNLDNYVSCIVCSEMFMKVGKKRICPKCRDKEDAFFRKVKDYLYEHPGASLDEVSKQTEVHEEFLYAWLQEGRLERAGVSMSRQCEMCGKTISHGRACEKCQKELGAVSSDLRESSSGETEDDKRSMYISGKK